jgi:2-oxoglutarate ferredoxin oxidoreductase subunit alpha
MSQTTATAPTPVKPRRILDRAVVRFAGDSGDGMQLTGEQFTSEAAWAGNDISTLPNFPAEIRAPAGTLFGVSSFQLQFGSRRVYTPGDRLDCLVAMNPAALKVHLSDLKEGGLLILNTSAFEKKNLDRAGYASNPLEDPALDERYRTHKIDITRLTIDGLAGLPLNAKEKDRCKNFFALGLVSWIYTRPIEPTLDWIKKRFTKNTDVAEANTRALKAGYHFGETAEIFGECYGVEPAEMAPGVYRSMTGNRALAWGILAAAQRTGLPVVYGLSHHARQRHPARAAAAQALPRPHVPGGGRDRGRRRGHSGLRRRSVLRDQRTPPRAQVRGHRAAVMAELLSIFDIQRAGRPPASRRRAG